VPVSLNPTPATNTDGLSSAPSKNRFSYLEKTGVEFLMKREIGVGIKVVKIIHDPEDEIERGPRHDGDAPARTV
jgi:hypothetical protein